MKRLITGDWHLDLNIDNFITKSNSTIRLEEQTRVVDEIVDYTIAHKIQVLVIAGDVYHKSRPSPVYEAMLISRLKRLEKEGIIVYILPGNHDKNMSGVCALDPIREAFKDRGLIRVVDDPTKDSINKEIVYLPHGTDYKHLGLFGCKYLIGHAHIQGAVTGSEQSMLIGGEDMIDKFPDSIKVVIFGHIHKPQSFVLNDTIVNYVGSTVRINFGERDDNKSFIIWDDEKSEIETVPIKGCIEYKQIEIDEDEVEGFNWSVGTDKITKVVLNNYKGRYSIKDIEIKLKSAVLIKAIVFNKEEKQEVVRDKGIYGLSPTMALKRHFKDHEKKERLIIEGTKILEGLENAG